MRQHVSEQCFPPASLIKQSQLDRRQCARPQDPNSLVAPISLPSLHLLRHGPRGRARSYLALFHPPATLLHCYTASRSFPLQPRRSLALPHRHWSHPTSDDSPALWSAFPVAPCSTHRPRRVVPAPRPSNLTPRAADSNSEACHVRSVLDCCICCEGRPPVQRSTASAASRLRGRRVPDHRSRLHASHAVFVRVKHSLPTSQWRHTRKTGQSPSASPSTAPPAL